MAKYGKKASDKVEEKMHELKRGKLRSGGSGKKVKSREQAVAIGLSEARREGGRVPQRRTTTKGPTKASRSGGARKSTSKSSAKSARGMRTGAKKR
jgi:hypothetical protein